MPPCLRSVRLVALLAASALSVACATRPSPATEPWPESSSMASPAPPPPAPSPPPPPAPPATCDAFARDGVLRRGAINRAVSAGLGRWLGGVEVDRQLGPGRRFDGWLVRRLYPGDPCYRDLDLKPGDVVRRVNGKSVERPDQANDVFMSLRTAPTLVVDYLREGKPRKLTLAIADE